MSTVGHAIPHVAVPVDSGPLGEPVRRTSTCRLREPLRIVVGLEGA